MSSAYLILDMQNDLVHANGANGHSALGQQVQQLDVVSRTAAAIRKARAAGHRIGFVRLAFSEDYREANPQSPVFGPILKSGVLKRGSWGAEIHEALGAADDDWNVVKHRVSAFYATPLELLLRTAHINRLFCSGVSTQAVVQATVRDAHDRDFEVVLLEDCCAAHSKDEHHNSVASLARFCTIARSDTAFDDAILR